MPGRPTQYLRRPMWTCIKPMSPLRTEDAFKKLHRIEDRHTQKELANKLRLMLLKGEWTQKRVAAILGVSKGLVGKVMACEVTGLPSIETLEDMIEKVQRLQEG